MAALTIDRARADVDPNSGIDFVRIGATYGGVGNPAYQSEQANQFVNGRGSVPYEYKIGKLEVTTAQWVEFSNAAFDRPSAEWLPGLRAPDAGHWGAQTATPMTPGGKRWSVIPGQELHPVGDISWRDAAFFCNWLCNNKSLDHSAFMNGAYDASTFGFFGNIFTDQAAHNPDAKYWIPTWDEWLKASHFDPNKDGGIGGWWKVSNGSDTAYVYGPPGAGGGQANAGAGSGFNVPLGAYPTVQSPWGLLDVAGATAEWTESIRDQGTGGRYRMYDGSHWLQDTFSSTGLDEIKNWGSEFPHIDTFEFGLRIASAVPSPGVGALGVGVFLCFTRTHRRRRSSPVPVAGLGLFAASVLVTVTGAPVSSARADGGGVDPNSGIDFVKVGSVGNTPWAGNGTVGDRAVGRGSVGYEYKIGKMEVTTAQWVEFFNAAFDRPSNDLLPYVSAPTPSHWGAQSTTPMTPGAQRWSVIPGQALHPVGDISWRMAAMYCNWLCNNKSADRSAFLNGAYDVSTFGGTGGNGFSDQQSHNPDASYWIPTWDERLKAAHFDPSKNGGAGGWWLYDTTSDTAPLYGPAGQLVGSGGVPLTDPNGNPAQANAGWTSSQFPGFNPFNVPLGAYPTVQSPWGLLDTAGGTREWTEETIGGAGRREARFLEGSAWLDSPGTARASDWIGSSAGEFPSIAILDFGFRIASAVPSPASCAPVIGFALLGARRTRRQGRIRPEGPRAVVL